jgi:GTP cyclohydrolase IA
MALSPVGSVDSPALRPSRAEAEAAVEVLLRWAGEDPSRPALADTPARVARAYEEWFAGYSDTPARILAAAQEPAPKDAEMVFLSNIHFDSHCEHHIAPVRGRVHLAYWPDQVVVGISKPVRAIECLARRMIQQESFTASIAAAMMEAVKPKGVAVFVSAEHLCMTTRGAAQPGTVTVTTSLTGCFKTDPALAQRFLDLCRLS